MRNLTEAARQIGATIEDDSCGSRKVFQVVAPDGFAWVDNGATTLRVEWTQGDKSWKADEIADVLERMEAGIEPTEN